MKSIVTVAELELLPSKPVQSRLYVAVFVGRTLSAPPLAETEPIPLSIEQLCAYRHSHSRSDVCGGTMLSGLAANRQIGFSATLTLIWAKTGGLSELEQVMP
jgi:hypothetical protein